MHFFHFWKKKRKNEYNPNNDVQTHTNFSTSKFSKKKRFVLISSEFLTDEVYFFGRAPGDMVLLVPLVIVMKFVAFEQIFWLGRRGKINKCWPWYVYFVIFINKRKLSSAMKCRLILFFQGGGSGYWFMKRSKKNNWSYKTHSL